MAHYRIANWGAHQHYKKRNPPWIKLHREMLSSRTWVALDDSSRVLAVACMLLAAASGNEIPTDPAYVRRVAYLNTEPDFAPLLAVGFLELQEESGPIVNNASNMQAGASALQADARPETEAETEADGGKKPPPARRKLIPPATISLADFRNLASALATPPEVDLDWQLRKFHAYHEGKGVRDGGKAAKNWLLNAEKFHRRDAQAAAPQSARRKAGAVSL